MKFLQTFNRSCLSSWGVSRWAGAFFFFCGLVFFVVVKVSAVEPGGASDPLITRSFLEEFYGWKVTKLTPGEEISLDLGGEAVLRSGRAWVAGSPNGGLADLTAGQDLSDGTPVPVNHHLLSPASDGRGIRAESIVVLITRGWAR